MSSLNYTYFSLPFSLIYLVSVFLLKPFRTYVRTGKKLKLIVRRTSYLHTFASSGCGHRLLDAGAVCVYLWGLKK